MITVLLPVYNGEKHLMECIKSILSQELSNFQLIVINDCSTDSSLKIIESFTDDRIQLINNPINLGLAATLNLGIKQSVHEIIVRIDQDDIMTSERLNTTLKFFRTNPDIQILFSRVKIINERGENLTEGKTPLNHRRIRFQLVFQNPFFHSASAYNRFIGGELVKYSSLSTVSPPEDFELWSRLILINKVKFKVIPNYLTHYRISNNSYSRNNSTLEDNAARITNTNLKIVLGDKNKELDIKKISNTIHKKIYNKKLSIIKVILVLFKVNRGVNENFKVSDLPFIIRQFVLIVFPVILKKKLSNIDFIKKIYFKLL